jgi:NAD-dependent dihydropyrimidine dehydrogenase PreA subunit
MMSDKNNSSEKKGPDYVAVIDEKKCTASGECIKICEVKAIYEGPKRMPLTCACAGGNVPELLPGKSVVDPDKCNGCGDCIAVCPADAIEMVPKGVK